MRIAVHKLLNKSRLGNILIVSLILLSLLGFTLESEYKTNQILRNLNYGIAIIIAVEYIMRVGTAPLKFVDNPHPYRAYILSTYGIIDLLAFLPALILPVANGSVVLRMLRIMRLFQLMKIRAVTDGIRRIGAAIYETRMELAFSIGISLAIIFLGAVLMYMVEGPGSPEAFGSVPRALWWSMATLTTVGYGDVYPITAAGKFLASVIALVGIVAVAMPAGILASAFTRPDLLETEEKIEEKIERQADRDGAS